MYIQKGLTIYYGQAQLYPQWPHYITSWIFLHFIIIQLSCPQTNYYIHMTFSLLAFSIYPVPANLGVRGEGWARCPVSRTIKRIFKTCYHEMRHCTNKSHHGWTDSKIPQLHARPYYGHHRTSYCPALLWAPQDFVLGVIARPYYGHHRSSYCPALLWAPQDFVYRRLMNHPNVHPLSSITTIQCGIVVNSNANNL